MEDSSVVRKTSHREWRRLVKKLRRKRLRQKAARERDNDAERLNAVLERSAEYLNWLAEREKQEEAQKALEEREHAEREREWLEEEERARKEWLVHQERKAKARQEQLVQEEKIRKEFEAKQEAFRLKKEAEERQREEKIARQRELEKQIDDYIDEGAKTPEPLRAVTESQPGKEECPFFSKTGACRYGDTCSRNHRRICLGKVILIPGFYSHFSLEKNSAEYDTDIGLEFESSETRKHFREFYKDVVPELESFGKIKTLKYCCNTEIHLRGNLYVEYYSERDAARAVRKLKGRWYAGRQLNCEFANVKSWRNAVCGMIKCPKGRACNFLHTFRNPHDEYDIKSPPRWAKRAESQDPGSRRRSKWEELDRGGNEETRDWRWSESPEPEDRRRKNGRHRWYDEEERHHGSRRERRHDESERRSAKGSRNAETSDRQSHSGSSRSKRLDEKFDTEEEMWEEARAGSSRRPRSDRSGRASDRREEEGRRSKRSERSSGRHSKREKRSRSHGRSSGRDRNRERESRHRHRKVEIDEAEEMPSELIRDDLKEARVIGETRTSQVDGRSKEHSPKISHSKTKWDSVESSDSCAESESNYSNSSTNEDDAEVEIPSKKPKVISGESHDGWETTSSSDEDDEKNCGK